LPAFPWASARGFFQSDHGDRFANGANVNPFEQLIKQAEATVATSVKTVPHTRGVHLNVLLNQIAHGGKTTRQLADVSGLTSNLVWGVLKGPRSRGIVDCAKGVWSLTDAHSRDLAAATALLRRAGYAVTPPLTQSH
jgi:hypothetical protein